MTNLPARASVLWVPVAGRHGEDPGRLLAAEGFEVVEAAGPGPALELIETSGFDVLLYDLLAGSGLELLELARRTRPQQVVVPLVAAEAVSEGREAVRRGAFHYLRAPVEAEDLVLTVQRASERAALLRDNRELRLEVEERFSTHGVIGHHGSIEAVRSLVRKVAPTSAVVMIHGETGTGKELVARAIHHLSPRGDRPLYAVNCASIPENLLESELFGYEKGAFTGASARKKGLLELASGSTLFLDEVGDLAPQLQAKLLRVLQERELRRVGGNDTIPVDLRVISASHRDLAGMVAAGTLRQDFYYRLSTFPIHIPPLRERVTDIPLLVEHFLEQYAEAHGCGPLRLSEGAAARLLAYPWPGNVRQLASAVERASILAEGGVVEESDLPLEVAGFRPVEAPSREIELPDEGLDLAELEKRLLIQALERAGGVVARAAPLLGLTYRTCQYRLAKHGIRPA